jgi:hypothetical protein
MGTNLDDEQATRDEGCMILILPPFFGALFLKSFFLWSCVRCDGGGVQQSVIKQNEKMFFTFNFYAFVVLYRKWFPSFGAFVVLPEVLKGHERLIARVIALPHISPLSYFAFLRGEKRQLSTRSHAPLIIYFHH